MAVAATPTALPSAGHRHVGHAVRGEIDPLHAAGVHLVLAHHEVRVVERPVGARREPDAPPLGRCARDLRDLAVRGNVEDRAVGAEAERRHDERAIDESHDPAERAFFSAAGRVATVAKPAASVHDAIAPAVLSVR